MPGGCPGTQNLTATSSQLNIDDLLHLKFVAYGIVTPIIIVLGILGNIANLIVLTRPNLKGVTFQYLVWLAVADLLTLIVGITSTLRLHGIQSKSYTSAFYYSYLELPLVNAFMACSVFLVVAVTIDRYFSLCLPVRYRDIHNFRLAKRAIIAAYLVSFILYIPVCFQKDPVEIIGENNKTGYIACEDTDIVNHTAFKIYLLIKEILVRFGPVVLLAVLNIAIIIAFRKIVKKRRHLLSSSQNSSNSNHESSKAFTEEQRMVALLGGIVVLFFVCMIPAAILTLLHGDEKEFSYNFQVFRAVANALELSNFALNFYVYCLCSTEIRQTFLRVFVRKKQPVYIEGTSNDMKSVDNVTKV